MTEAGGKGIEMGETEDSKKGPIRKNLRLFLGLAVIGLAVTSVYFPELTPSLSASDSYKPILVLLGMGVLLYGVGSAVSSRKQSYTGHRRKIELEKLEEVQAKASRVPGNDTDILTLQARSEIRNNGKTNTRGEISNRNDRGPERRDRGDRSYEELRNRVRKTAVNALVHYRGYSEEEAERLVENGSWTEDVYASSFLGNGSLSWHRRFLDWLSPEPALHKKLRRTVDEIESLREGNEEAKKYKEPRRKGMS